MLYCLCYYVGVCLCVVCVCVCVCVCVYAVSVKPEAIMASILAYTWPSKLICWIITIFATLQVWISVCVSLGMCVRACVCVCVSGYRPELKMGKGLLRNSILVYKKRPILFICKGRMCFWQKYFWLIWNYISRNKDEITKEVKQNNRCYFVELQ